MCFAERAWRLATVIIAALLLGACGSSITDDLLPSGDNHVPPVVPGTIGPAPGQIAPDFTLPDTVGGSLHLADRLAGGAQPADAVVLYFTMWCPVCLSHTDHMLATIVPRFAGRGTVVYALIDYVSGSVEAARAMEQTNGYAGSAFTVVVDAALQVFDAYHGAMGKVVVIGADGVVRLSEDYRNGENLAATLDGLLP
jgi:peroxiredoxin